MTRRQRCFMEIEVGGVAMGKITMELFNDKCPRTCENFRALCTGEKGIGKTTEKPLHYLSSIFHRVVRGFMIQGGDFSNGNGTGGESIYGGVFPDEDLDTKHDIPFLLSMANRGKDTNGSQFFITTDATPHLDGIHVVFGQIKTGEDIVKYIEGLPVDRMCRPMQDVKITRCGELVLKNKAKSSKKKKKKRNYISSSESASSDSDEEPTPAKLPRKPAGQEVDKIPESTAKKTIDEEEIDDVDIHPLVTVSKIDPAEIPDIPRNKYLLRGAPEIEKIEKSHSSSTGHKTSNSSSSYNQRRNNRYGMVTKSGRHIKGRGKFRFRTPSPSDERSRDRSRSATPPHWRQAQRNTIKMSEYKKIAQSERINREKEVGNRAAERFSKANGTENGSARDLKRNDSSDKKEKIHDQDIKQSVELVFVKGSRDEEQLELKKPEEKNEPHELQNPESPQQNSAAKKEGIQENNEVKITTKSDEEIVTGQPLDLNALDYEVTEFEQAESEHSIENENEIETEQCTVDKEDIATDAADIPSGPVPPELGEQAPDVQTAPSDMPMESGDLASDAKITELLKKDKTASKPAESSTSSSKRPSQRSSSRTRRSNSRTRRSNSRTRRSRRRSSSSDRRRRRSDGRSSRHERERKFDRHDRRRRSRSGERRSNGASSRRRRSSSSGSSSPSSSRRHRTRR